MFGFADFKRERIEAIGARFGQVGDLVVCDQDTDTFAKFELPAFFTITEVQGKPGWYKYAVEHHGTGEILEQVKGDYLYKTCEYFKVKKAFVEYSKRILLRREKDEQIRVAILSEVLASRGIVTVITEDEQAKLKKLIELEEAKED